MDQRIYPASSGAGPALQRSSRQTFCVTGTTGRLGRDPANERVDQFALSPDLVLSSAVRKAGGMFAGFRRTISKAASNTFSADAYLSLRCELFLYWKLGAPGMLPGVEWFSGAHLGSREVNRL
jgi:hypothetical protein